VRSITLTERGDTVTENVLMAAAQFPGRTEIRNASSNYMVQDVCFFLTALGVFFPIYINTLHGIRSVDPQLVEMGKSYGMNGADLFRRVILPGALPSIFVGLRYGLGIMWLTLIVAETISASAGLGYMAMQAREFLMIDVVVLSILIYALLGKLADSLARLAEGWTLQWHPAFQTVKE